MDYLVTSAQAKKIDTYTIEQTGVPSLVLMERAALTVAESVAEMAKAMGHNVKIAAVCGAGNNGGDGIAAARILYVRGYDVTIVMAGNRDKLSKDAAAQLRIAENFHIKIVNEDDLSAYTIIIDAVFGIGLARDVAGRLADWIKKMNDAAESGSRIVAVDVPSGIDADSGRVRGCAVCADRTITFGFRKLGLILYPGCRYAGRVYCQEIGFDTHGLGTVGKRFVTYTEDDLVRMPERTGDANKGTYGKVLVIAGSENMAGAAYLSAKAAYRMGAGLVYIFTPSCNRVILQQLIPEAVLKTYEPENINFDALLCNISDCTLTIVGPGIGRTSAAECIVKHTLRMAKHTLIIDADALNIISEHQDWLSECSASIIMTPHIKELSRLTGYNIQYLKENLVQVCEDFICENGVVCIAKDARTMIFEKQRPVYVNTSGNDGMSTGGSGDVLTGVIGALCAQGMASGQAARLGVYLHGRAGDLAAGQKSRYAMTAVDLLDALPMLLKSVENKIVGKSGGKDEECI